jgi:hypothetical protein
MVLWNQAVDLIRASPALESRRRCFWHCSTPFVSAQQRDGRFLWIRAIRAEEI